MQRKGRQGGDVTNQGQQSILLAASKDNAIRAPRTVVAAQLQANSRPWLVTAHLQSALRKLMEAFSTGCSSPHPTFTFSVALSHTLYVVLYLFPYPANMPLALFSNPPETLHLSSQLRHCCTALYCTVLQRTAPYRNVAHHTATYRTVLLPTGHGPSAGVLLRAPAPLPLLFPVRSAPGGLIRGHRGAA